MDKYTAPDFVDINITNNCNMNCTHCYIGEQNLNEMSLKQGIDDIRQLRDLGVFKISLTGGEPLLHPNFLDFIKEIKACDMEPMVNSNGVLFNDSLIDKLDKILINKKMLVAISLDGLGNNKYSELRKWKNGTAASDAFDIVIKNAYKLVKKGYLIVFNFTYTNLNKSDLFSLYDFLEKKFKDYKFILNIILFGVSGNGVKNKNELSINYNDWKSDINRIMKLKLKGKLKYLKIEPTCPWEVYVPLEDYSYELIEKNISYISPLRNSIYNKSRDIGCHAGITNIVINWDGKIYPCGLYPVNSKLCLGDLNKESLLEIWNNSVLLQQLRKLKLQDLDEECQQCNFKEICGGGCRGAAIQITQSLFGKDLRCPLLN